MRLARKSHLLPSLHELDSGDRGAEADHVADLDLLSVAPNGRLAAFCIGWLHRQPGGEIGGQIEPLGVHADFRRQGLGCGILAVGLRRLQQHGAEWM